MLSLDDKKFVFKDGKTEDWTGLESFVSYCIFPAVDRIYLLVVRKGSNPVGS